MASQDSYEECSQGSSLPSSQGSQVSFRSSQFNSERIKELLTPISDLAKNFDVDLTDSLKEYLDELASVTEGIQNGTVIVNFAEAALVIQGSTNIFGKKVEFLYGLTYKLLQHVHNEKASASGSGKAHKDKDVMLAGRHASDRFVALDDIPYKPRSDLMTEDYETVCRRYNLMKTKLTPLPLIPLDDHEKGNITLKTSKGEVIGNKRDFQMNICQIDSDGCLYLPSLNFNMSSEVMCRTPRKSLSYMDVSEVFPMDADDDDAPMHEDDDDLPAHASGTTSTQCDDIASSQASDIASTQASDLASTQASDLASTQASDIASTQASDIASTQASDVPPLLDNGFDTVNTDMGADTCDDRIHEDPISPTLNHTPGTNISPVPPPDFDIDITVKSAAAPRRRSERQAILRAQKLSVVEEVPKKKPAEKEPKRNPWDTSIPVEDVKIPIQKKCTVKMVRRMSRKSKRIEPEVEPVCSSTEFVDKHLLAIDSKCLKKMGLGMHVNDAFEHLVVECYKDEQEIVQKMRKKLSTNANKIVLDGEQEMEVSDNEDAGVGADLSDSPGQNGDNNFLCISPDSGCMSTSSPKASSCSEEDIVSYEDLLQQHVDDYMKDTVKYTHTTELAERVKAWEDKIKPILEEEDQREAFNIHLYGTRIIDSFADNNRKQSLPFAKVCKGKSRWEVCRYLLATLILANTNNVEISVQDNVSGPHEVNLSLLSRKRHQEQLDAFGHNSGEHE